MVMNSISISGLAPELLYQLFFSFDSLCDVSRLASVSKTFREICRANAHSILYTVAPRHTQFFDEAQALLDAQDHEAIRQGREVSSDAALLRIIRLVDNEQAILTFSDFFIADCIQSAPIAKARNPPLLTKSEIARFQCAYYRLWALMESTSTNLVELIAKTPFRELICLNDVQTWVRARFYNHNIRQQPWSYNKWTRLYLLGHTVQERCHSRPPLVRRPRDAPMSPSWIPWTIWDEFQEDYVATIPDTLSGQVFAT